MASRVSLGKHEKSITKPEPYLLFLPPSSINQTAKAFGSKWSEKNKLVGIILTPYNKPHKSIHVLAKKPLLYESTKFRKYLDFACVAVTSL